MIISPFFPLKWNQLLILGLLIKNIISLFIAEDLRIEEDLGKRERGILILVDG